MAARGLDSIKLGLACVVEAHEAIVEEKGVDNVHAKSTRTVAFAAAVEDLERLLRVRVSPQLHVAPVLGLHEGADGRLHRLVLVEVQDRRRNMSW